MPPKKQEVNTAGGNFLKLCFSLNVLLMFTPCSLSLEYFRPQAHTLVFFSAGLGMIPLAGWLGRRSEAPRGRKIL